MTCAQTLSQEVLRDVIPYRNLLKGWIRCRSRRAFSPASPSLCRVPVAMQNRYPSRSVVLSAAQSRSQTGAGRRNPPCARQSRAVNSTRPPRPLAGDVDFTVGRRLVMPGLTAWQGLFRARPPSRGQSVPRVTVRPAVGSMAAQPHVRSGGTLSAPGRAAPVPDGLSTLRAVFPSTLPEFKKKRRLKHVGEFHLVFDVLGGAIANGLRA